jgi:hypothetical protein
VRLFLGFGGSIWFDAARVETFPQANNPSAGRKLRKACTESSTRSARRYIHSSDEQAFCMSFYVHR